MVHARNAQRAVHSRPPVAPPDRDSIWRRARHWRAFPPRAEGRGLEAEGGAFGGGRGGGVGGALLPPGADVAVLAGRQHRPARQADRRAHEARVAREPRRPLARHGQRERRNRLGLGQRHAKQRQKPRAGAVLARACQQENLGRRLIIEGAHDVAQRVLSGQQRVLANAQELGSPGAKVCLSKTPNSHLVGRGHAAERVPVGADQVKGLDALLVRDDAEKCLVLLRLVGVQQSYQVVHAPAEQLGGVHRVEADMVHGVGVSVLVHREPLPLANIEEVHLVACTAGQRGIAAAHRAAEGLVGLQLKGPCTRLGSTQVPETGRAIPGARGQAKRGRLEEGHVLDAIAVAL
mmetsp:Transcript_112490/g.363232  ORF Transcript_112490/g.363232 Transcript_112490/m.363232 type:complete len:348 (+) Transcript_112490:208-1251(+)